MPVFALLFILARGAPVWLLYRHELPGRERAALALMASAALPLIVAITEVATETGRLGDAEAVSLVCAGMVSLLVLPAVAIALMPDDGSR